MTGRPVVLVDTEVTAFGRHEPHTSAACAGEAMATVAARHPGLIEHLGEVWLGAARPGASDGRESGLAISAAGHAGLPPVPAHDVHAFCASANVAFHQAVRHVQAGLADVAIVAGVEHMYAYPGRGALVPEAVPAWVAPFSPPAFYGMAASRYLHEYGLEAADLAGISVRNRAHAAANPLAMMRDPVTVEEVAEARMVSTPLTLLHCCPRADGAGAAIVAAAELLDRLEAGWRGHVAVRGMGLATVTAPERASLLTFPEDVRSSASAYEESGRSPADVDVAEVHDAFTVSQALHLEDVGLAARGEGALLGSRPGDPVINPSGGLLGRGHPLGATGMAQFDAVRRHLAEGKGRVGLVQEAGGLQLLSQMLSVSVVLEATET